MEQEEKQKNINKFDKIAGSYNLVDYIIPTKWRQKATALAYGLVLEVGIGTGLNLPFYSASCTEIVGIDISPRMLEQAKEKAAKAPGVIATIVESITRKPLSKTEILDILVKKFPDRSPDGMWATVSIQLGPTRLGSKFKLLRDGDKFHIAG